MNSLELMQQRLKYFGGKRDIDRVDWQKNRDLEQALLYSDKSEFVQVKDRKFQVLIEGSKYSYNTFDEKEIQSVKKDKVRIGDILYWFRTKTYWVVLEQDLEETAVFKGRVRKCSYLDIEFGDIVFKGAFFNLKNGEIQQTQVNESLLIDVLSDNAKLILPVDNNSKNLKRYDKLKIGNRMWEIQSIDNLSQETIISIYLKECYVNPTPEIQNEQTEVDGVYIDGELEILPYREYTYKIIGDIEGDWAISENSPIKILNKNEKEIVIEWNNSKKGDFTISYGTLSQKIKAKSLF